MINRTRKIYCNICKSETELFLEGISDNRFGIDKEYSIVTCTYCNLSQISPIPSPEELKNLYETYYNFNGEKNTIYTRIREWFLFSIFYRLWMTIDGDICFHKIKGSGRLLDIGCNEGRGLKLYQQNGFNVEGLELNEKAAAIAQDSGFLVHTIPIEHFSSDKSYDIVILSNVLEHSLNPKIMLSNVHRILNPDGQLWISCPNYKSWLRVIFGRFWINWHVPFHIFHFSLDSLIRLLEDSGFYVIEIKQKSPSLWVAQSIITLLFSKEGKPTKQLCNYLLVAALMLLIRGLFFPLLWLGNMLGRGDCLVVIANKV